MKNILKIVFGIELMFAAFALIAGHITADCPSSLPVVVLAFTVTCCGICLVAMAEARNTVATVSISLALVIAFTFAYFVPVDLIAISNFVTLEHWPVISTLVICSTMVVVGTSLAAKGSAKGVSLPKSEITAAS